MMDTGNFFKEIRKIIREEIEIALENKEKENRKYMSESILKTLSLLKSKQKQTSNKSLKLNEDDSIKIKSIKKSINGDDFKPVKSVSERYDKRSNTSSDPIASILEETRRSIVEGKTTRLGADLPSGFDEDYIGDNISDGVPSYMLDDDSDIVEMRYTTEDIPIRSNNIQDDIPENVPKPVLDTVKAMDRKDYRLLLKKMDEHAQTMR